MAFRRRLVRRRAPVYRRRGNFRYRRAPLRRRVAFRRRRRADRYVLRARYSYTHTIAPSNTSSVQFKPKAEDFAEFSQLAGNFEAYKFASFTVTVRPLFNTSSQKESCPPYVSAPYHVNLTQSIGFNECQSLNQCKTYNGTRTSYRRFVPAVLGAVQYVDNNGVVNTSFCKTNWKPRLEITNQSTRIPHYCCVYVFDADAVPKAEDLPIITARQYEITLNATFIMYTQKNIMHSR
ncbi:capsid protein [Human cyclovirus VS5700009]|uniref:Capsid protein n=1 Tax=Human cyclovirus VS5700009 TaxID=1345637 RepID=R9WB58_9CIRC|nr:capsid protein [Human cyclovirus VS5700009]AGN96212.1 capsid protein [Human cyclovirus VS5700009]